MLIKEKITSEDQKVLELEEVGDTYKQCWGQKLSGRVGLGYVSEV